MGTHFDYCHLLHCIFVGVSAVFLFFFKFFILVVSLEFVELLDISSCTLVVDGVFALSGSSMISFEALEGPSAIDAGGDTGVGFLF